MGAAHSNHCHCGAVATHPRAPLPNRAAQHSSGNASCIPPCMLQEGLERIRKCFCDRTNHTEHWTILQRLTVITRTDKTTLRAWQDHDRNSRQGRTRLHLKRDCHRQTDYHNFQRQHPWTRHHLCKPHALLAASASHHAMTLAQLCTPGGDMTSFHSMLQYQGP